MELFYIILVAGGLILLANVLSSKANAAETPEITAPLIAAVIVHEAGGEGEDGMNAVAGVIQERSRSDHKTPYQVVTQRKQFSCLNNMEYNHDAFVMKARHLWSKEWPHALRLAYLLNSNIPVPTSMRGAYFYCTTNIHPSFRKGEKFVGQVGHHLFFRK